MPEPMTRMLRGLAAETEVFRHKGEAVKPGKN